jgi:opacity protein-like surface antigen
MELPHNRYKKEWRITKQTLVKNVFVGLCFSASILLVSSAPVQAQVLAHSGEVAGNFGYATVLNSGNPDGDSHPFFGGSGAYNVTSNFTVLGEYFYMPLGSYNCAPPDAVHALGVHPDVDFQECIGSTSEHVQHYGGAVRYNLLSKTRIVPYLVGGVGGARGSGDNFTSVNGYDFSAGGGVSFYIGHNWGVRPEFRYMRFEFSAGGTTVGSNAPAESGSVFYQWGGRSIKR